MNNEKTEKQLISLILESSKYSVNLSKKYLSPTKKLFESVFYQEEISVPVNLNECRNNKLFYFNQVKNNINELSKQTNVESLKIINESLATPNFKNSVTTFLGDLSLEIDNLKLQNDFDKIDVLNPMIKKTLLFSGKPLNIVGFDIMQFLNPTNIISLELKEKFGALISDLKLLVFNKSDKEIYFIFERKNTNEKTIIFYNIIKNELDYLNTKDFFIEYGTDKNKFFTDFWKNEKNYLKMLGHYINNNLVELYRNNNLFNIEFKDNLYGDYAFQNRKEQISRQNVIKKSR